MEDLGSDAEFLQPTRPEVLDEDVGAVDQSEQVLAAGVVGELEHDAPLVAPQQLPEQPVEAHLPRGVAGRALDLDDGGAEVGEVAGAAGTGHDGGEVDHPEAGQRRRAHVPAAGVEPALSGT